MPISIGHSNLDRLEFKVGMPATPVLTASIRIQTDWNLKAASATAAISVADIRIQTDWNLKLYSEVRYILSIEFEFRQTGI